MLRGTCDEVAESLDEVRGEITVVVGPVREQAKAADPLDEDAIAAEFWALAKSGRTSRRAVVSELARKFKVSSRYIYSIVEKSKRSGE
jgi:16S rRNA C1402 (ribose-2'-O) methylase RsmI